MKPLYSILTIGLSIFFTQLEAQGPTWPWAKGAGGSSNDYGHGVCADAAGNSYVTGGFSSPSISFGTNTFTNGGGIDYFVAKYDPSGAVLWANTATGISNDGGNACAVDATGNLYVVGSTNSHSLKFGSVTLTGAGYDDIILVKYDPSGNVLWAKDIGGSGNDIGQAIGLDAAGNAYITGYFASSTISFGSTVLTNSGTDNVYVAKYDPSGNVLWAKKAGGTNTDHGNGIAVDAQGNSYVTGSFTSSPCSFVTASLANGGGIDMFMVKYDAAGNEKWVNKPAGVSNDVGYNLALDPHGNPIFVGSTNSTTLTFGNTVLTLAGGDDVFIAKYDTSGVAQWAKIAGGSSNDIGESIGVDADGSSYITGYFASATMSFGSTTITTSATNDIFVAKYDASGALVWAKSAGGNGDDRTNCIGVNWHGEAFVTGYFTSLSCPLGGNTLTNGGTEDFFIAKLGTATGIVEVTADQTSITVSPNPSSGMFTIQLNGASMAANPGTVTVSDMTGRQVKNFSFSNSSSLQLDLSEQANGIYFVSVNNNGTFHRIKVVITK
jgi:hypothetical protein